MSVTVILNGYRRPEYLDSQLHAIHNQSVKPDEVWLWHNHEESQYGAFDKHYKNFDAVVKSSRNFKFHGRFALGLLARTEYVAFFDDDTIPGARWLENCTIHHEKIPGILGGVGIVLRSSTYGDHDRVGWPLPSKDIAYCDLVGHAWFLKRENLKYLWSVPPISLDNGEDIQLSLFAKKHGGLPTYCPPHPPEDKSMWSSLAPWELGNDSRACSNASNPDWAQFAQQRIDIVREALKRGWNTVRNVQ